MNFPQGTFFLFQHFPGIEFKELGVPGTRDAPQTATKLTIWLTLSLFIGAFSAAPAATEGEGLRYGTWGKESTTPLTLIKPKRKERTCRFFSGYLEYRSR
jgi:hypothetical protein